MGMHAKKRIDKILYHGLIGGFGLIMIYPVFWMIIGAFKNNNDILNHSASFFPTLGWHMENWGNGWKGYSGVTFGTFFKNSLIVATVSTFGTVISSSMVAYALARVKFKGRKLLFWCMLGTLMLPGQVIMIPQYMIYNFVGLVGTYVPLILPHFCGQAFFIYQMMQFCQGVPRELDEAAFVDGCNKYMIYFKIILPLLKPSIVTTLIIQFYWKWDDFMGPLIYLSKPVSWTASVALKNFADASGQSDYGALFAMSTLSLIPVFLIFLIFNRQLVDGVSSTGLKG
ncbi:MAG: binding-protein-dependent transport system inner rane component [Lacrimispora sp.]|nr:binding-protein-dependent transport system inner rane component [Lacrimispora sp.]